MGGACYTIDDVTRLTGVSRRTVRYYVTRGLIPPPDGRGVGLHYGQEHVDGILRVLEAKQRGATLADVAREEHVPSRRADGEPDGSVAAASSATDCTCREATGAVSNGQSPSDAAAAPNESRLARASRLALLGRCSVENRTGHVLVISDGKGKGEALILQPGGRTEVEKVTLSLVNAEMQGLIAVTPV
jgi:DNA-binding transcriptional MerR regulator